MPDAEEQEEEGGSVQLRSSPRAQPSSLPHLPGAPVSPDLSRAPGLPPLAPRVSNFP